MTATVWKIFIPHNLFGQSSSYLFGEVSLQNQAVFITASTESVSTANWLSQHLSLVGIWYQTSRTVPAINKSNHTVWIRMSFDTDLDITCRLMINNLPSESTAVVYDTSLLVKSTVLQEKAKSPADDNLTLIYRALQSSSQTLCEFDSQSDLKVYSGLLKTQCTVTERLTQFLFSLVAVLYVPFWWIKLYDRNQSQKSFMQKVFTTPTTIKQLGRRAQDLKHGISNKSCRTYNRLRTVDSCCRQMLDTMLGLLLMFILMQGDTAQVIANTVLTYADVLAGELKTLLHWLIGAPAGFKLNSQLTHLLSQFFQYHIYLWTGYLYFLKPVLGYLVYYSSVAGIWGLTVQLSLYQDIFSTLTLHIYCFYVYAARLYRLQLYALASFWRLFRGKKWNVLRQRVDSAVYDADQLFIGTLLFTVLLFLLPTTLIYYFVFTLLRLFVLMIQFVVGKFRHVFNTVPVWSIWLWLSRSPLLTDGAHFHVMKTDFKDKDRPSFVISMQMNKLGLSEVIALTHNHSPAAASLSLSTFFKNLVHGDLVFPWIKKN